MAFYFKRSDKNSHLCFKVNFEVFNIMLNQYVDKNFAIDFCSTLLFWFVKYFDFYQRDYLSHEVASNYS